MTTIKRDMALRRTNGIPTPQQKLSAVNDNFGNPNMKKQQGSTIEIYDTLEIEAGKLSYEFFKDAQGKKLPFSNLNKGVLQPQESFVMLRAYFFLMVITDATGAIADMRPLDLATDPGFAGAEIQFYIVNQRVIRPFPVKSFFPEFNENADTTTQSVYNWDTQLVIPPLLEFKAVVDFPAGFQPTPVEGSTNFIGFCIGGPGGIFAPKDNY